jgi:hypothetical protein
MATVCVSNEGTMKRRVLDYLAAGKTLTENEARSRFGVRNFRAMISDIRRQVEQYGNWSVYSEPTARGTSRYGMEFNGTNDNPFANRVGIV